MKGAGRALDLFEAYAESGEPMTLTEVSQRIGVPASSCHALLRTLQARGYLYRMENFKRFYPTNRLSRVAEAIAEGDQSLRRLAPIAERLREATGETVIVGKMLEREVIYLDIVEGRHIIRYATAPGDRKPAHSSAIGKAALSFLEETALREVISRLPLTKVTDRTITDPEELIADIAEGRNRGYFVSRGETVSEVMGVAVTSASISGEEIEGAEGAPLTMGLRPSRHSSAVVMLSPSAMVSLWMSTLARASPTLQQQQLPFQHVA